MRRLLRFISRFIAAVLVALLLILNLRFYLPSSADYAPDRLGPDVVSQLNFIGAALRDGAGQRMQRLFPEGFFFSHALYGLAWVDAGMRRPAQDELRAQALAEARWALAQLDTPAGRAPFSPTLDPPLGVFYVGWY
jgi:hypothetical protein